MSTSNSSSGIRRSANSSSTLDGLRRVAKITNLNSTNSLVSVAMPRSSSGYDGSSSSSSSSSSNNSSPATTNNNATRAPRLNSLNSLRNAIFGEAPSSRSLSPATGTRNATFERRPRRSDDVRRYRHRELVVRSSSGGVGGSLSRSPQSKKKCIDMLY